MKFSRFLGVAITGGALLGGDFVQAQINYRVPASGAHPQVASAPVSQPYAFPPIPPFSYPTTNRQHYSVASVPSTLTQFSGPTNAPMTRLPPSDATLAGHSPAAGTSGVTATNSVLTSPFVGMGSASGPLKGPITNSNIGPITAPSTGPISGTNNGSIWGGGVSAYDSSRTSTYTGIGYGGTGTDKGIAPIENNGAQGAAGGVGSAAFQPFGGSDCGTGCYVGPNCWYGGLYGLVLTRDRQEHYTFSYDNANESVQYTDAKDADIGWGGGFAAVAGRYFNCGQNAIEAVYWGWFPDEASTSTFGANTAAGISGIFNWDSLTYNALNMGAFVDNAAVHSLFHESEAHNIELNVLSFSGGLGSGPSSLHYTLLAGVRYFRFRDHLTFRSDPNDVNFTGEVDEIFYDISTTNNLIGFQIGGVGTYSVGPRLSLNGGTKVGFFGNHISHSSQIGGVAGTAVINNGPNAGLEFNIDNTKNDVAFLSEIFFGAGYAINDRWSASAGYRAVAVTGLAAPTDQIYPDVRGINDLYTVESQSSLILHGAYFGAQFSF